MTRRWSSRSDAKARWEATNNDEEQEGFAISASVVVSENLLILAEFGKKEIELDGGGDIDEDWFVIEAFITF